VPFSGETPVSIALKHVNDPPTPPKQFRPDLPAAVEQVILKALSKDQTVRHVTAQEFLRDLQAAKSGHPASRIPHPASPQPAFDPDHTQLIPRPVIPAAGAATPPDRKEPWMERTTIRPRAAQRVTHAGSAAQRETPWGRIMAIGALLAVLIGGGAGVLFNVMGSQQPAMPTTVVPNLVGQDTNTATQMLQQARLHWGRKKLAPNDSVPRGHILDQEPLPGTQVAQGSNVDVTLSQGPPIQIVTVPDVTEMSRNKAEEILQKGNLTVGNIREEYSDHTPAGYVMDQSPRASARVEQGTPIDLILSKGSEPAPQPTSDVVITQPDDSGKVIVKLTVPSTPATQSIKIIFRDDNGDETVFHEQSHVAGENVEIPLEISSDGEIRVYIEDNLVKSQRVKVE
jgi:serine/threonine-protein kinase